MLWRAWCMYTGNDGFGTSRRKKGINGIVIMAFKNQRSGLFPEWIFFSLFSQVNIEKEKVMISGFLDHLPSKRGLHVIVPKC